MRVSQETKQKIRSYLLDCIDLSGYDRFKGLQLSERERFKAVWSIFLDEYATDYNLKYYGSEQKTFENWLMGLPSCFNIDFENYKILELNIAWGFLPEKASERKEQLILDQWWGRIYMTLRSYITRPEKKMKQPGKKLSKLFQAYGLNSLQEYFDYILASGINGQLKQSKELFLALPKLNQIEFVNSMRLTERQREAFTMLLL